MPVTANPVLRAVERAYDALLAHGVQPVHKTIWGSPAGKKRIADRLVGMLPAHKTYVEPFAGSAAVLFAKEPAEVEVINDADTEIARAYKLIQKLKGTEGVPATAPPRTLFIWPGVLTIETVLTDLEFQYGQFAVDASVLVYTATGSFEILDVRGVVGGSCSWRTSPSGRELPLHGWPLPMPIPRTAPESAPRCSGRRKPPRVTPSTSARG